MKMSQFIWPFISEHSGFLRFIYCEHPARQYLHVLCTHVGRLSVWCKPGSCGHCGLHGISICPSELPLLTCTDPLWIAPVNFLFFPKLAGHLASGQYHSGKQVVKSKVRSEHLSSGSPSCWMSVNGQHSLPEGSSPRPLTLGVWTW